MARASRQQSQSVVLATLVVAALVPTLGAITNFIQARASATTLQKVEVAVNSKSDAAAAQIKELIQANKELANKVAVLEERRRPVNEVSTLHTLTDEQFKLLLKQKEK